MLNIQQLLIGGNCSMSVLGLVEAYWWKLRHLNDLIGLRDGGSVTGTVLYLSTSKSIIKNICLRNLAQKIRARFVFTLKIEQERAVKGKEVNNGTRLLTLIDFCLA
jgi:hypothetical protein